MSKKNSNKVEKFRMTIDDKRGLALLIDRAMPTIYEAFVEIITNSDAGYAMLHGKEHGYRGDVLIELERGGKINPTKLVIKDRGIGMSYEDIKEKLVQYLKGVSTTQRSFFGKGFKDCRAVGDITIKSVKKIDGKLKYSEAHFPGIRSKKSDIEVTFKNNEINDEILKKLGVTKARAGHTVEFSIPPESGAKYNPTAESIREKLPNHYALSKLMDKENGNLKITFVNKGDKPVDLFYIRPEAKLVFDENTTLSDGSKASLKLWRFEEPFEDDSPDKRFQKLGISIYGTKGCHEKSFLIPNIENDEYRKRYFGELQCENIDILMREYVDNLNKSLDKNNPVPIIEETRTDGLNRKHPFITNILFPWASKIIKGFIDEDRGKDEKEKGKKDESLEKQLKEAMKLLSKEIEDDNDFSDTDIKEIGKKKWQIICPKKKLVIGETVKVSVKTQQQHLKSGVDTVEFVSDSTMEIIEVDETSKKLVPLENNPEYLRTFFLVTALKEGEQTFKIHHGGILRTEFPIKVIPFENHIFKNPLEFEHKEYTVGLNKERNLKVYAKYPEVLKENQILQVNILDDSAVKVLGPTEMKIVEGSNFAEGSIKLKGLKLNGVSRIVISLNDNFAETVIKVTEKEEQQKPIFDWDIGEHRLGNKRATWDPNNPNILKISTLHPAVKKYLGSQTAPYPNSNNPAWITMMWEILCEKFAEKKVQQTARRDPEQYANLRNLSIEETINQTQVYFENAKAKLIEKFMPRIDKKLCDLGSNDKDN